MIRPLISNRGLMRLAGCTESTNRKRGRATKRSPWPPSRARAAAARIPAHLRPRGCMRDGSSQ
eukprot:6216285-Pyramimonas_sp.AAC.1